jgi:type IV pilus biogenesis protein CpaD/CtpE
MLRAPRLHAVPGSAIAVVVVALVAGCGDTAKVKNDDRPPAPIIVTASISKGKVSVSPTSFGAGPITLVITNQTDRSQQITLESADDPGSSQAGIRQETGPINPQDTASLAADVREGSYQVHVRGDDIRSATVDVGAERESSQQDLLLP